MSSQTNSISSNEYHLIQNNPDIEWRLIQDNDQWLAAGPMPWNSALSLTTKLNSLVSRVESELHKVLHKSSAPAAAPFKVVSNTSVIPKQYYVLITRHRIPPHTHNLKSVLPLLAVESNTSKNQIITIAPNSSISSTSPDEDATNLPANFRADTPLCTHPVISLNHRVDTNPERVQSKLKIHLDRAQQHNSDQNNAAWYQDDLIDLFGDQELFRRIFLHNVNQEGFRGAIAAFQNNKPSMQDDFCHITLPLRIGTNTMRIPYFGIFDGHGKIDGARYSLYVKHHLPIVLNEKLRIALNSYQGASKIDLEMAISNCIKLAFTEVSENAYKEIHNNTAPTVDNAGTTAVLAFILHDTLWVANAGDSRAILSTHAGPQALSTDAKPEHVQIDQEIPQASRSVFNRGDKTSYGPKRGVRCGISLAMTHALGHITIPTDTNPGGINPRPEIIRIPLDTEAVDKYLVMASDGLWDVASTNEVSYTIQAMASYNENYRNMAETLIKKAHVMGSQDNITVLVVNLQQNTRTCACELL